MCRTLTRLKEMLPLQDMSMGLIVYCGIDEYDQEVVKIIKPKIQMDVFYYNCGNKFVTHIAEKYTNDHKGNIVFADGNGCIIYEFKHGRFTIKKKFDALLQKRQRKGGQSAVRIARLAEETRHMYVVKAIDHLNALDRDCKTVLFGSNEITSMIMAMKTRLCPVSYGGFLDFNLDTIKNAQRWIEYLNPNNVDMYDDKYRLVLDYLDIPDQIDMLDFSPENAGDMNFCLTKKKNVANGIPFPNIGSKYYDRLKLFEYVGVKYYNYQDQPEDPSLDELEEPLDELDELELEEDMDAFM